MSFMLANNKHFKSLPPSGIFFHQYSVMRKRCSRNVSPNCWPNSVFTITLALSLILISDAIFDSGRFIASLYGGAKTAIHNSEERTHQIYFTNSDETLKKTLTYDDELRVKRKELLRGMKERRNQRHGIAKKNANEARNEPISGLTSEATENDDAAVTKLKNKPKRFGSNEDIDLAEDILADTDKDNEKTSQRTESSVDQNTGFGLDQSDVTNENPESISESKFKHESTTKTKSKSNFDGFEETRNFESNNYERDAANYEKEALANERKKKRGKNSRESKHKSSELDAKKRNSFDSERDFSSTDIDGQLNKEDEDVFNDSSFRHSDTSVGRDSTNDVDALSSKMGEMESLDTEDNSKISGDDEESERSHVQTAKSDSFSEDNDEASHEFPKRRGKKDRVWKNLGDLENDKTLNAQSNPLAGKSFDSGNSNSLDENENESERVNENDDEVSANDIKSSQTSTNNQVDEFEEKGNFETFPANSESEKSNSRKKKNNLNGENVDNDPKHYGNDPANNENENENRNALVDKYEKRLHYDSMSSVSSKNDDIHNKNDASEENDGIVNNKKGRYKNAVGTDDQIESETSDFHSRNEEKAETNEDVKHEEVKEEKKQKKGFFSFLFGSKEEDAPHPSNAMVASESEIDNSKTKFDHVDHAAADVSHDAHGDHDDPIVHGDHVTHDDPVVHDEFDSANDYVKSMETKAKGFKNAKRQRPNVHNVAEHYGNVRDNNRRGYGIAKEETRHPVHGVRKAGYGKGRDKKGNKKKSIYENTEDKELSSVEEEHAEGNVKAGSEKDEDNETSVESSHSEKKYDHGFSMKGRYSGNDKSDDSFKDGLGEEEEVGVKKKKSGLFATLFN